MSSGRILLLDDEPSHRTTFAARLAAARHDVEETFDLDTAVARLRRGRFTHAFVEPNLTTSNWYISLRRMSDSAGSTTLVVVTSFPSEALAREASERGVRGCLAKPVSEASIDALLRGAPLDREERAPDARRNAAESLLSLWRHSWEYINTVLRHHRGNVALTARTLAISRQTLYRKLRTYPSPR